MGWSMDFTGPQMVLTLKLISVAFNVYDAKRKLTSPSLDGITDEKVLADKRRVGKMIDTIAKERAEFALTSMPSVLEYLGFIYFPTSLLAGPVFELAEYRNLANNSIFKTSGFSPSGCATATLLAVCKALVMMGLVMVSGMYPISAISSTEYGTWSVGYRWYFLYVSMALIRCKYYFGWFLSEGACILSGLGYAGVSKEGKNLWNRCQNVSPLMCELPENSRSVSDGWNSSTARWLKRYVYLRVGKVGQPSTMSTYATFIVSAFWHGFYPGYYFSFVSGALFVETSRQLRRDLGPLFDKQGPFYSLRHVFNLGSTLLTVWVFAYMCGPFQLLDAKMAWQLYIDLQFAPHIASVATLLLLSLLRPTLRKMMRARQSPAAAVAAVAGEGSSVPRAVSAS
jgi:lysophospholipid acyltransferase